MFLILRGRLAGYLPSSGDEKSAPDFEVGPGEIVGEMAFVLKTRRNATLACTEDCSLLAFSQQELFAAANASPLLPQVKQAVDSIVRTRILQNVCRSATYLSGEDRTGPLGAIERPWEDLRAYSRTISVGWQERDLHFDAPAFRDPGLYLLAGGRLEMPDGTVLQPQNVEPPIVAADLPGEVRYRPAACRLLDDVTILFIGSNGFDQFGRTAHDRLAAEVRARTASDTAGARPAVGPVAGTAVEGLLKVGGAGQGPSGVDVIFVHGLDGDARSTWHKKDNPALFWPAWLAEDVPGVTVWSLGYEVSSSAWRGSSMPLSDRATNALATLETQGLGDRADRVRVPQPGRTAGEADAASRARFRRHAMAQHRGAHDGHHLSLHAPLGFGHLELDEAYRRAPAAHRQRGRVEGARPASARVEYVVP